MVASSTTVVYFFFFFVYDLPYTRLLPVAGMCLFHGLFADYLLFHDGGHEQ